MPLSLLCLWEVGPLGSSADSKYTTSSNVQVGGRHSTLSGFGRPDENDSGSSIYCSIFFHSKTNHHDWAEKPDEKANWNLNLNPTGKSAAQDVP
jgi:hypothetical protein